jgi:hypothetical protein
MPPLADHTAAYLAAQMRRADEVAEATGARRLAAAGIGSFPGGLAIKAERRTAGARLVCLGERLRGVWLGRVGRRSGTQTALGLIDR